jgi:hypothetical protein
MIEFYNVRKKEKVSIDESKITPVKYERTSKTGKLVIRYGLKATDAGTKLTKFCNKEVYESLGGE